MARETRIPTQKRSIEKKNSIIDAAFKIFNEKGYHNTNTVEIAKEAGIATGSIYAYFEDKKHIFIDVLRKYSDNFINLFRMNLENISKDDDLLVLIKKQILTLIDFHDMTKGFHSEVMALSYLDEEIKDYFNEINEEIMKNLMIEFESRGFLFKNKKEKVCLAVNCVDCLCHDLIYNQREGINREKIIDECAAMIKFLISS